MNLLQFVAVWRHKRRWSRRNVKKLRTADAVVVSHTKSGRTWLRVMISYLYHLEYGTPANALINFDNLHQLNPFIPRIYFTRDTAVPRFLPGMADIQVRPDQKVLFLLRDPRDATVSFYFHVVNRASDREMIRKGIARQARSLPLYAFVLDEKLGVSRVIEHYNRWVEEMKRLSRTLVVRYEDLRADPVSNLGSIIEFLDHRFRHEDLVKAVEFASFESLSRKEKEGFFASGRLRPVNPQESGSFKVRRGKIGGYRDYFTAEQNDRIDMLVRRQLHPSIGYT
jgi:Sulfotransferase domain